MGCDPTGKVTQLHSFVSLCCTHKHNPGPFRPSTWLAKFISFFSLNTTDEPLAGSICPEPSQLQIGSEAKAIKNPSMFILCHSFVFMKQALFSRHLMGRFGLAGSIRKDSHRLIRHGLSVCFGSLPAGPVPSQWVAIQVSKQLIGRTGSEATDDLES